MDRSNPRERVAEQHRTGTGTARVPYPITIRTAPVVRKEYVTERMVRLTVGGEELTGFHSYQADDHVRIVLPEPDGSLRLPTPREDLMLNWPRPMPPTRKYTVRRWDPATREIDLDFVLHRGGLASTWVEAVGIGEDVHLAGPPGAKTFPHNRAHYVFAVDATALPAAARWIEESPPDVSVQLVVETDGSEADEAALRAYPLAARDGLDVRFCAPRDGASTLADTVAALPLRTMDLSRTFLFAAGEAESLRGLRAWSKGRLDALFTGYWKRGVAGLED
ncbi:siderophore-interacting protein [Streptomyces sp. XM4193]|uniref:siderophore-interacting protein n=1 Tax=Streptomyces sp. XM4193 TaxID=2929782 RepID=UPI001FFB32F8|nr:siderophore-interacting protein [Streptomyces sp. XM4193]MCK1794862.1 siderophore-interacting protein [Streptomyces sp. XM4193]